MLVVMTAAAGVGSHRSGTNNRIVQFTKDGTFIREWGRKGSGPGEFSEPNTIAIDSQGRLFVGVDAQGNVYGAVVRRQMLERHVRQSEGA